MIYMFIFSAFGTIGATFLGAIFSKFVSNKRKEVFNFFQNFSVGGIIALLFFELIIEAVVHFQSGISDNLLGALYTLLIIGGVGFWQEDYIPWWNRETYMWCTVVGFVWSLV